MLQTERTAQDVLNQLRATITTTDNTEERYAFDTKTAIELLEHWRGRCPTAAIVRVNVETCNHDCPYCKRLDTTSYMCTDWEPPRILGRTGEMITPPDWCSIKIDTNIV